MKRSERPGRAAGATQIGTSSIPSIGLTGADQDNLTIANINQRNQVKLANGNLNAQQALAKGELWGSVIGSVGSAAGGIMGGAAGTNTSGTYGQLGSWIGGLLTPSNGAGGRGVNAGSNGSTAGWRGGF